MIRVPGSTSPLRPPLGLLVPLLMFASCAHVQSGMDRVFPGAGARMAASVTIYRDEWGVPHIYGPTDASVAFGMAYAQAEDNFWQIEEDFARDLGRAAELYGESELGADLVRAAFEVERLSREEYEREPPATRRIWDAFARGLNFYLDTHPEVQPRLLTRFEPWFIFARFRAASPGTTVDGVRLSGVVAMPLDTLTREGEWLEAGTWDPAVVGASGAEEEQAYGSNTWAVAPARTAERHALLFHSPHVGFFGGGQRYEAHLRSEQGWHFSGFAILGSPMPRAGHNEHLGWSHTDTGADGADAYELTFDHPTDRLSYRYGDGWRQALEWDASIGVRTAAGIERRRFRFRKTHHGPVVSNGEGTPVAVRLARFEEGGALQQWYAMGKATSLEEFRAALGRAALPINTMYADGAGNIMYVHGNAVPRRAAGQDWSRPVDGASPANEWQGYHTLDELPQLQNPASGWLQNANATPFLATADGHNLQRDGYPSYMAPEADNGRARVSRTILASDEDWTLEELERSAFDTRVAEAAEQIPALIDEWERFGARDPERAARLDTAIHELFEWDHVSTIESVPMTYFLLWLERMRRPGADTIAWARVIALEETVNTLARDWGRQRVPWGEVNRLQRIHTSGQMPFDDARHSLPIAGAPGWAGIVFNFYTRPGPEAKRRYGTSGHTGVSVVEFAPRVRARSVVTFGQSANPASPHWFDQAPLYAEGRFKEAWFWHEDVERNARRSYRPGSRQSGGQ